ncbi:MAG: S-layer homology domain-containing protein, partial [Oscillospiraceae bacterium]|nr:S-layer homology domain-containing protein [Oscillospiraceae bacterium]
MKLKRTLSLILSICMLISLLPATVLFAGAEDGDGAITYEFNCARTGTTTYLDGKGGAWNATYKSYPADPADAGEKWAYLGTTIAAAANVKKGFCYVNATQLWSGNAAVGEWVALKIYVPETGTYNVSAKGYQRKTYSESADLYIAPMTADLEAKLTEGNETTYGTAAAGVRTGASSFEYLRIPDTAKVGSVSFYKNVSDGVEADLITGAVMSLTEGDNVVLFKATALNHEGDAAAGMHPSSITLTPISQILEPTITVSAEKTEISIGESITLSSKVYNADGTEDTSAVIEYTSSDTSKFIIDGNTATAVGAGSAMITASVKDNPDVFGTIVLEAKEVLPAPEFTAIEADFGTVTVGHKLTPNVKWISDQGEMEAVQGTVTCEIIENNDNILLVSDNGEIYTLSEGSAKVKVTGTLGDVSKSVEVEVTVITDDSWAGENATYFFYAGAYPDLASFGFAPSVMNEENFTSMCTYQDYGEERPWGMVATNASRPSSGGTYFGATGTCTDFSCRTGEWVALKVKVPAGGRYSVDMGGYAYRRGGRAMLYMIPYDRGMTFASISENIDKYTTEANLVGDTDFKSATAVDPMINFGIGSFEADKSLDYSNGYAEYLLIVKSEVGSSGDSVVMPYGIYLIGEPSLSKTKTTFSDVTVAEGESVTVTSIDCINSVGNKLDASAAYISTYVKEGSEDILKVHEDGKSFKALKEGEGYIVTRAIMDGSVTYEETKITVDNKVGVMNAFLYLLKTPSIGEDLVLTTRLEQNDRKIKNAGEIVELEIVESSKENVLVLSADKKTATAKVAGTAKIRAKILARGIVHTSDEVEVFVSAFDVEYPTNFMIDFRQGAYQGDTAGDLSAIKEYSPYRNWIFYKWTGPSSQYPTIGLAAASKTYAQVVFDGVKDTNYLAFKVQFPISGKYNVDVTGYCRNRAACMEMFVIPATPENEANLQSLLVKDNEYYFGTADCYRSKAETASGVKNSFGTGEIPSAGEYIVVFRTVKGQAAAANGDYGDAWYPLYISFTNGSAMSSAKLETENGETTIEVDTALNTKLKLFGGEGDELNTEDNPGLVSYKSSDESIAIVDTEGRITAVNDGKAEISATVSRDGNTAEAKLEITVVDSSGIDTAAGVVAEFNPEIYAYAATKIKLTVKMNSGRVVNVPGEFAEFEVLSGAEFADLAENVTVTGKTVGDMVIQPSIKAGWKEGAETMAIAPVTVTVGWDTTINPAIVTMEERENVAKNAKRYDWAKKTVDAAKADADRYLANLDAIYDLVVPEGLPRYYHVGHKYDPKKFFCRYCNCNIGAEYGSYPWVQNPLQRKWKIQCPECKRLFPSNDFGSFYELGLTESGSWSYDKALAAHHKLFVCADGENCTHEPLDISKRGSEEWYTFYGYGVEGGYLTNNLFGELDDPRWGVDDSRGYLQKYVSDPNAMGYDSSYSADANGNAVYASGPVQHTYIAVYLHDGIWYRNGGGANSAMVREAIVSLSTAFAYTGEAKYGRAGAILLDRVADVYPDFDWYQWHTFRGDAYRGVIVDPVWSTGMAVSFAESYDRLLPIYNDPYITDYLAKRNAARYEVDENGDWKRDENGELIPVNLKDSPGALRKHIEDNILLKIFEQTKRGMVWGNFGMHQNSVTTAALALNRMPETGEMLDWIMKPGVGYNTGAERAEPISGGYVMTNLINEVDRDGNGNENALGYNRIWINNLYDIAVMLNGYELYPSVDLFRNVKFTKMFLGQIKQTLGGYYGPQTGDSGAVASKGIVMEIPPTVKAFEVLGTPTLAQAIYMKNGETVDGIYGSIYDPDPEKVQKDIEKVIEEYGLLDLGSDMMTGYGFAALRAGGRYDSASSATATNDHRDFAIYFGGGSGHGHPGILNLYMSAFGLNTAPDLGYPEQTGSQPNRYQWVQTTLSHNTVVVDEEEQKALNVAGTPYHFDDSGMVKVMDVDANVVYPDLDDYRRTVFMVDAGDDVSYGVDFFHVNGGSDHLYSFHSQSDEISIVEGLDDVEVTPMYTDEKGALYGTYAGPDVKFGDDPGGVKNPKYPLGYTWMKNVRTFNEISDKFTVEFNVKDWNNAQTEKCDVRLKMTVLSDADDLPEEVTFTEGYVPQRVDNKNIGSHLEYVLIRNKGNGDLNTTFTTVFEPHEANKEFIESIEKVSMVRKAGEKPGLNDAFGAVKVTLKNGRTDYVIYSTNNAVNYVVDDKINFRGFGGVMSFEDDKIIYRYLNDGEVLTLESEEEREKAIPAYTGVVKSFTDELQMENFITYTPAAGIEVDVGSLAGKYVYVDNDKVQNGAYKIISAEKNGSDIVLNIGDVSLIRSFLDANDYDLGYVYNIAKGNTLRIPLVYLEDGSPVFDPINDITTSAGSSITIPINAHSPIDRPITIVGTALPRGMSVNTETGTLTWKPSGSQVGENHVAITATDGSLQTTVHFTVTVYGSTTGGSSSNKTEENDNSGSNGAGDTSAGGGGGGGGGAAPTDTPSVGDADSSLGEGALDEVENGAIPQFVDLGNHAWAEDAINTLANDGIIKGTSASTFSPASTINRADFALLLVRAFKLSSDTTE